MKLTIFNRTKYKEAMEKLQKRNAPDYVIEAYNHGYTEVVNYYYKLILNNKRLNIPKTTYNELLEHYRPSTLPFIQEALTKRDEEFLKAFFIMTNLDIVTGKKLPPSTGSRLKPSGITNIGFKDVLKKLK